MIGRLLATEDRSAIERWCRDRAMAAPCRADETLCRVLGEHLMLVSLRDLSVAPHLVMDGYWEMWNSICLAKRIKPGWRCVDVGASWGYYTLLLSDLVGPHGRVVALEPNGNVFPLLEHTMRLNGRDKLVSLINEAAGAAPSPKAQLWYDLRDLGGATLATTRSFYAEVTVSRLDEIVGFAEFVKLDGQGCEPEIFSGMSKLLDAAQPKAMLVNWSPRMYQDAAGFLAAIRAHGYAVSVVSSKGDLVTPPDDLVTMDGSTDLWCERP
jgi:FkbM family methyltransferase